MPPVSHHCFQHYHVASATSTNTELMCAIKNGFLGDVSLNNSSVHVLTADVQTAGRGQKGRTWQSPKGNVYLSLYHPLSVPLSGLLSLVVGYYVVQTPIIQTLNQALAQNGKPIIGVKWANDIGFYVDEPNVKDDVTLHKLAGVLIEPVLQQGRLLGVIIGLGVNVYHAPILTIQADEGTGYQPVGLADLFESVGHKLTPTLVELYAPFAHSIQQAIKAFEQMKDQPYLRAQFINKFGEFNILQGCRIYMDDNKLNHQVLGIADDGGLRVQEENGLKKVIYATTIKILKP